MSFESSHSLLVDRRMRPRLDLPLTQRVRALQAGHRIPRLALYFARDVRLPALFARIALVRHGCRMWVLGELVERDGGAADGAFSRLHLDAFWSILLFVAAGGIVG